MDFFIHLRKIIRTIFTYERLDIKIYLHYVLDT